jgi:hypothetical protein
MKTLSEILDTLRSTDYTRYYLDKPGRFNKKTGQTGKHITFIPWYSYPEILDQATDGMWEWELTPSFVGDLAIVIGKLTIIGSDGKLTRTAIGNESSDADGFGDPSNASAMAFRRVMALFGVGLELWDKKSSPNKSSNNNQRVKINIEQPTQKGMITRDEWLRLQHSQPQ